MDIDILELKFVISRCFQIGSILSAAKNIIMVVIPFPIVITRTGVKYPVDIIVAVLVIETVRLVEL
jgi:hypothetical protein